MRIRFNETLAKIADQNPNVYLVVGDVSPVAFPTFTKNYPERFINVGIAEANMIGVASGLALSGKIPILYTIGTFMTMRCYEQIRDDLCFQNLNVKLVGVGGGIVYSTLGATHHSTEDIAIMKVIPNMTVMVPCDPLEAEKCAMAAVEHSGPVYIRMGKAGEPKLHPENFSFEFGKANYLREGRHFTIVSAGIIQRYVVEAAEVLAKAGIETTIVNMHTIKPLDKEAIRLAAKRGPILTVEEHQVSSGLGSSVAEILAEEGFHVPFRRLGLQDTFIEGYGDWEYLLGKANLTTKDIVAASKELLR